MIESQMPSTQTRLAIELSVSAIVIIVFCGFGYAIRIGKDVWTFEWGVGLGVAVSLMAARLLWWVIEGVARR